jgi:hypothetical protein
MIHNTLKNTVRRAFILCLCALPAAIAVAGAPGKTDLSIEVLDLSPPSGSTLKATDPIHVTFRYRFTKPNGEVRFWAKILDPKLDATYIGIAETLEPGTGILTRTAYLTEPGKVKTISVVAKDENSLQFMQKDIPVDYTYIPNKAIDKLKGDGVGSKIVSITIAGGNNAVLKKGVFVPVDVRYAINAKHGLIANVYPDSECSMTFAGLHEPLYGNGVQPMGFTVGEKCVVKRIKLVLWNTVSKRVFDKTVDVNLKFID